jgi:hypothetical protein
MNLFAQIRKVDEEKRLVYGRLTQEVVDKSDEILDYESSKPHFVKWSQEIAKDTDGKSVGNLRAMHGKVAAGKFTEINFNDAEKAIDVCAKVVDNNEWSKVLEGVYRGFSIGGAYVGDKKVEKVDGRDVTRYTAKPNEGSLVDSPCVPTAKFFEVQKADGTLAKVDFQAPAPEDATIHGTPEEVDALCKLMNEHGLSMADVLAKVAAPNVAAASAPGAGEPAKPGTAAAPAAGEVVQKLSVGELRKSMYSCSFLAETIASLMSLKSSAQYEAFYEGDDSGIAAKLGAVIALAGQVLIEMVQEEVSEGDGADTTLTVELAEKAGALAKIDADPFRALLKVGARNSAADKERLAKIHEMTVELGHDCAPAAKTEPVAELTKVDTGALEKMVADAVATAAAPLSKALEEANAKITKLEAQPAPARVHLRAVAKTEDTGTDESLAKREAAPIKDDHGDEHHAAGLIKSMHRSGGRPLIQLQK